MKQTSHLDSSLSYTTVSYTDDLNRQYIPVSEYAIYLNLNLVLQLKQTNTEFQYLFWLSRCLSNQVQFVLGLGKGLDFIRIAISFYSLRSIHRTAVNNRISGNFCYQNIINNIIFQQSPGSGVRSLNPIRLQSVAAYFLNVTHLECSLSNLLGKVETPNNEYRNNSHKHHKNQISIYLVLKKKMDGKFQI